MGLVKFDDKKYVTVLGSDATFRLVVDKNTEGATLREYESSDGVKGEKWELVFNQLFGKILNIEFHDGEYGKNLLITVSDGTEEYTLSLNTGTPFGEDMLKKLPSVDLTKEVSLTPYAFEDDKGKTKKGMTVKQDGVAIKNFFYDGTKNINGYPEPKPKKGDKPYTTDDWKIYFTEARIFLVEYVEEKIIPTFSRVVSDDTTSEIVAEEIAF